MTQYAINIKGLSEEKLCELFDVIDRRGGDVIRENRIAFPRATEPMVELGYDLANVAWIMAPRGYFHHKTILSPDEFLEAANGKEDAYDKYFNMPVSETWIGPQIH